MIADENDVFLEEILSVSDSITLSDSIGNLISSIRIIRGIAGGPNLTLNDIEWLADVDWWELKGLGDSRDCILNCYLEEIENSGNEECKELLGSLDSFITIEDMFSGINDDMVDEPPDFVWDKPLEKIVMDDDKMSELIGEHESWQGVLDKIEPRRRKNKSFGGRGN